MQFEKKTLCSLAKLEMMKGNPAARAITAAAATPAVAARAAALFKEEESFLACLRIEAPSSIFLEREVIDQRNR